MRCAWLNALLKKLMGYNSAFSGWVPLDSLLISVSFEY